MPDPAPAPEPPAPAELPPVEPTPPPLEVPAPAKPPPERPTLAFRTGVAVSPEYIVVGEGWVGFSIDAGMRFGPVSMDLGAHGDPPLAVHPLQGGGSVSRARLMGTLVLCGHFPPFITCLTGDAGAILLPHRPLLVPASVLYGALGGAVGVEYPVVPPSFYLGTTLDVSVPIQPQQVPNPKGGDPVLQIVSPNVALRLVVRWDVGLR